MPFPGWVALAPALGAAAVILAGLQGLPENLSRVLSFKPIAFTGDISYSLYLWHWPLIILLPWATGYQLRTYQLALILVVSYALAWASKRFIEDRFRSLPWLTARLPRASFAFGLVISMLVFGISLTGQVITSSQQSSAANQTQTLDQAKNDTADPNHRCMTDPASTQVKVCRFGVLDADYRVLLVGDSHAAMHLGAWQILAEQGRFEVDLAYKASCSFNLEKRNDSARGSSCQAWNIALQKQLAADKKYDLVVTSYFTTVKATEIESANHDDLAVAGFKAAWAPLQARGTQVLVVRDGVNMSPSMRDCWQSAVYDASNCSMPESQAFGTDLAMRAASSPPGALTMDFSDLYCQNGICPAKIGKLYVYRDSSHISLAFSRSMANDWLVRMTEIGIKLPHPAS
jgi:hypothetical protein